MYLNEATIALVQAYEIPSIIEKDMPIMTTKSSDYLKENSLSYYVVVNTWLLQIKEYSQFGWMRVKDAIFRDGLVATIKRAQVSSDELIHAGEISDTLFKSIYTDILTPHYGWGFPSHPTRNVGKDPISTILSLLRYPKRFSPLYNDVIAKESIRDFLNTENRTKLLQRREYNRSVIYYTRKALTESMPWDKIVEEIKSFLTNPLFTDFPTGVGSDAGANLGAKLRAVSETFPEALPEPFGIPYTGSRVLNDNLYQNVRPVKVAAVPKSYKTARIIAMEPTVRQVFASEIAHIIDRYLPVNIPIHEQKQNQVLAELGSVEGDSDRGLATIDLSHASDCISKSLASEIFPADFMTLISPFLGNRVEVEGKFYVMQQLSTAGNALTFILESLVFYGITLGAFIRLENLGILSKEDYDRPRNLGTVKSLPQISVYGDDIICPVCGVEMVIQHLTKLGFIVNEDKSFWSGGYRESCGMEFLDGLDVSSIYYPRFPITGVLERDKCYVSKNISRDSFLNIYSDTLSRLIDLQHRLYYVSYAASRFLYEIICRINPRMTSSEAGTLSNDLWEYEATYKESNAPYSNNLPQIRKDLIEVFENSRKRYKSLVPVTRYVDKKLSEKDQRVFNVYKYHHFLKNGPQYEDPLMELLGISMPPIKESVAYGTPNINWVYREI